MCAGDAVRYALLTLCSVSQEGEPLRDTYSSVDDNTEFVVHYDFSLASPSFNAVDVSILNLAPLVAQRDVDAAVCLADDLECDATLTAVGVGVAAFEPFGRIDPRAHAPVSSTTRALGRRSPCDYFTWQGRPCTSLSQGLTLRSGPAGPPCLVVTAVTPPLHHEAEVAVM